MRFALLPLLLSLSTLLPAEGRLSQGHSPRRLAPEVAHDHPFRALNATLTQLDARTASLKAYTCATVATTSYLITGLFDSVQLDAGVCICVDSELDQSGLSVKITTSAGVDLDIRGVQVAGTVASLLLSVSVVNVCEQAEFSIKDPLCSHNWPTSENQGLSCCARACPAEYDLGSDGGCVPKPPVCLPTENMCNGRCYPSSTTQCVSGYPQPKKTKRDLLLCPAGQSRCPVRGAGWECVDTKADIESCGGCLYNEIGANAFGEDCTAIPHVNEVTCLLGQCQVRSCQRGYQLDNNGTTCVEASRPVTDRWAALKVQSHITGS